MGNTFGHLFRVTTWGESHGGGVGVVVDGCPPRMALTEADIQPELRAGEDPEHHKRMREETYSMPLNRGVGA